MITMLLNAKVCNQNIFSLYTLKADPNFPMQDQLSGWQPLHFAVIASGKCLLFRNFDMSNFAMCCVFEKEQIQLS